MDEFLKSFKAWLYDKSSNPLFFIFVLCWLAWNYKLMIVAFSAGDPMTKLNLINTSLYPTPDTKWQFMLLYPGFTAAATVITYPALSNLSAIIFKIYENFFAHILLKLDHKKPIDEEVARLLRSELISLDNEKKKIEAEKNEVIENLRKTIVTLQSKVPHEKKLYPFADLTKLDKEIFELLLEKYNEGHQRITEPELTQIAKQRFDAKPIEIDVSISKLTNRTLVNRYGDNRSGVFIALTERGKEIALQLSEDSNN